MLLSSILEKNDNNTHTQIRKNHQLPVNYRSITLLSSLSKMFSVILYLLEINLHGKIRYEQFDFRPRHSTSLQLTHLIDNISIYTNINKSTASIFLDTGKAFDRIWHDGLIFILTIMKIPTKIFKIITSFLSNRSFSIKMEVKLHHSIL